MKNVIFLLGIWLCCGSTSFSQCQVSTFIEDNYTQYGKFMALREIQGNPADPDYDNPIVPISRITPYLEKLSAIYENPNSDPLIDQLFDDFSINVNPEYMFRTPYNLMTIGVDNAAPWLADFINTGISENSQLDNLISSYNFYIAETLVLTNITVIYLETTIEALNIPALEDEFLAVNFIDITEPDVWLKDRFNYDGISYRINNEPVETCDISVDGSTYTFCLFAGDCPAGCQYAECWVVEVSEDCSIITVLAAPDSEIGAFTVFPNPASDLIHIHGVTSEIKNTLIYSVTGQLMNVTPLNSETINISNLPPGIYFLEISTAEGNKQLQKFIKH